MVALSVPRLDYRPSLCLCRQMLFGALDAFDRGEYITAGCKLREAVARFLTGAVAWYGCEVKGKYPRPADLARALHRAKFMDKWSLDCILEMIDDGNRAAHCGKVDRDSLCGGIAMLFRLMDNEGYVDFVRTPIATSHKAEGYDCDDCDDDDGADWWKSEGGAA